MTFKGPWEIAVITSMINAFVYIEILDNFIIWLIEKWFGDDEVIFPDNHVSCHKAKGIKVEVHEINNMACEQFRSKSNWKFMVKTVKNSPCKGSIHQRRSINCHLRKLDPLLERI